VNGDPRHVDDAKETGHGQTKTLHDAFLDELRDTYDAERQIVKALRA